MINFFENLKKIEKVKDFKVVEDGKSIALLNYDDFQLYAVQFYVDEVCLSKIIINFDFKNSKKNNKLKIYDYINQTIQSLPLVRITLKDINSNSIDLSFMVDYSIDDKYFTSKQLEKDLDILITASALLEDMLKGKTEIKNNKG